ncbi:hydroxyisourate hydrolase [Bailinhaonella thermotolerans]|uniref:5-hydroxyisourate hydrolase n=1 Tax=Bailinhaonella thermotolerans TaxID=1070861 RepID=A0A3A4ADC0_9ACTN|nr:hydroxyisourate hydrolase [Bailinhaonella thermotolerans]RJL23583.1 hydroxyisourate hydrolase [Bailinhaonella thermotolerans]
MSLSTHVLDATRGRPAEGVAVRLETADGVNLAEGRTDHDGRLRDWAPPLTPGEVYRLVFDTGSYFGGQTFYPEVTVTFRLGEGHHHVPLLLSPFAYSTYRGS